MSSRGMPLATREPRNGGLKTGLSSATAERAGNRGRVDLLGGPLRLAGRQHPPARRPAELGVERAAPLALDEGLHGAQSLEGVLAVEEPALVDLPQVPLHVAAGQGGAAEQDRDLLEAPGVQLLEVLPHDQRALDQQAAHADGVGLELLDRVDEVRRSAP